MENTLRDRSEDNVIWMLNFCEPEILAEMDGGLRTRILHSST